MRTLLPGDSTISFIIDWEDAQFGHRAVDIASSPRGFTSEESLAAVEGCIQSYGPVGEYLAYATAVHAGAHLICWYYRRERDAALSKFSKW
ncbi:hypothetical protein F5Y17DRAFT_460665 [Xylariaceae sp. FL0594]|nr:hypothetical protein F5Y17DRAFT_460665 [Xylariaceae sp. FL0594]